MTLLGTKGLTYGTAHHAPAAAVKLETRGLNLWYNDGRKHALIDVTLTLYDREVTALIGPSGCGKSSLIQCCNRIIESIPGTSLTGDILLDGASIFDPGIEPNTLRRHFGWVAQMPNPFPRSIHDNVAYGAQLHGLVQSKPETDAWVEHCLTQAGLWDEVKDRLGDMGPSLSGGQQQRLCIARALSTAPDVILMDEPCSSLDPMATASIEALIDRLRASHAIVLITHNLAQAARVSQRVVYFHLGRVLEVGDTQTLMAAPETPQAQAFLSGRFG